MSVKIRLTRMGQKKKPYYRIVVADSRSPRDGRIIETIGSYNPVSEPKEFKIEEEKAIKWMMTGAKPTDTVNKLFKNNGVLEKFEAAKKA